MRLKFVDLLAKKYNIREIDGLRKYFNNMIQSLIQNGVVLNNVEDLTATILSNIVEKAIPIARECVDALTVLLGRYPSEILFPSPYYYGKIENATGKEIDNLLHPEILLPFSVGKTFRVRYNTHERIIYAEDLYTELYNIYISGPVSVFIVSKFIDWRGFYHFIKVLDRVRKSIPLPKTYIVTAEPILEDISKKYNIVRIPTKSHAKVMMIIWKNKRYCYLGSMNVLSPSKYGDFLLMFPGVEKYCVEFLLKAILS